MELRPGVSGSANNIRFPMLLTVSSRLRTGVRRESSAAQFPRRTAPLIKNVRVYWLTCAFSMLAAAAAATTIILPTDAQLVAKTPLIVQGTVVSSEPVLRDDGRIWTETKLSVEQTLKGSASGTITVREI